MRNNEVEIYQLNIIIQRYDLTSTMASNVITISRDLSGEIEL